MEDNDYTESSFVSPGSTNEESSTSSERTSTTDKVHPTFGSPVAPIGSTKCNVEGQYDGEYGIEHWPPVYPGYESVVDCPTGHGNASWECIDNSIFDPNGPDWTHCNNWIDGLEELPPVCPDKRISMCLEKAIFIIDFISNVTKKNNSIVESEKLSKVLDIICRVQTFVESVNVSELIQFEIYANYVVDTLAHIMDQKYAWIKTTEVNKTALALKILIGTQSSAYSLSRRQNPNKSFVEIANNDFYINTFFANKSAELRFPANHTNSSSIYIPADTTFINYMERKNTAFGVIIKHIDSYLLGNLSKNHRINSDILTFSLSNNSEGLRLNKEVTLK